MPARSARSSFTNVKFALLLQDRETRELQAHVVVVVEVVEADDLVAAREQLLRGVEADEAGGAGDEDLHRRPSTSPALNTYLMS